MNAPQPQPHLNTPTPILADECLLPGGARVVVAPPDGWTPRKSAPHKLDDVAWWTLSLGTAFMAGVMVCLLVVAVMFRIGGARIVLHHAPPTQPTLLDMADTMAAQELREGPGGSGEVAR